MPLPEPHPDEKRNEFIARCMGDELMNKEFFVRQFLQEIGRALGMPPGIVMGNFSGYNYASGRLDLQVFLRAIGVT